MRKNIYISNIHNLQNKTKNNIEFMHNNLFIQSIKMCFFKFCFYINIIAMFFCSNYTRKVSLVSPVSDFNNLTPRDVCILKTFAFTLYFKTQRKPLRA